MRLKELLELEFSKDVLVVKDNSLKAIVSFTNPSIWKEFVESDDHLKWLSNVVKVDFKDAVIDWDEKYLDVEDEKFYKELKEADVFVI